MFDARCLMHAWWFMAHGSRLMAHGQGRPGEAHGQGPARPWGPRAALPVRVRPHAPLGPNATYWTYCTIYELWISNILNVTYWDSKTFYNKLRFFFSRQVCVFFFKMYTQVSRFMFCFVPLVPSFQAGRKGRLTGKPQFPHFRQIILINISMFPVAELLKKLHSDRIHFPHLFHIFFQVDYKYHWGILWSCLLRGLQSVECSTRSAALPVQWFTYSGSLHSSRQFKRFYGAEDGLNSWQQ